MFGIDDAIIAAAAPAVIGGVSSLFGGNQANQKSWDIAMATNAANAQEAQKTRDWQEQMRKTQYQTSVEDLKAAGLNPMLAYTQGGAGTPAGATATAVPAKVQDAITPAVTSALSAMGTKADYALKTEQVNATSAQAEQSRTQALANIAETARKQQDEKTSAATEQVQREMLGQINQQIQTLKSQQVVNTAQAALTSAQAKGDASQDPWYVRDAKKFLNSAKEAWDKKIVPTNKYLQGK